MTEQEQLQPIQGRPYRLTPQPELEQKYTEVRAKNLEIMRKLPRGGFWGKLPDDAPAKALETLQAENAELRERLANLEQIVLEHETAPSAKKARA